jgi:hypothetical protein
MRCTEIVTYPLAHRWCPYDPRPQHAEGVGVTFPLAPQERRAASFMCRLFEKAHGGHRGRDGALEPGRARGLDARRRGQMGQDHQAARHRAAVSARCVFSRGRRIASPPRMRRILKEGGSPKNATRFLGCPAMPRPYERGRRRGGFQTRPYTTSLNHTGCPTPSRWEPSALLPCG